MTMRSGTAGHHSHSHSHLSTVMEEGGESSCTSSHLPPSARRFGHAATPTNAHGHAHADFLSTVMDEHAAAAGGQRWEPHFTVNTANDILDNNNKENMQALPRNAPKQDDAHLLAMLHQDPALMLQIQQSQANAVMVQTAQTTNQTAQTTNQTPSASALGVQMNDLRQWYPKLPAGMAFELYLRDGNVVRDLYRTQQEFAALDRILRQRYPSHAWRLPVLPMVLSTPTSPGAHSADEMRPRSRSSLFSMLSPLRRPFMSKGDRSSPQLQSRHSHPFPHEQSSLSDSSSSVLKAHGTVMSGTITPSIEVQMEAYLTSLIHDGFIATTPELDEFLTIQPVRALFPGDTVVFEDGIHYADVPAEHQSAAMSAFVDAPEAAASALVELANAPQQLLNLTSEAMLSVYDQSEHIDQRVSASSKHRHSRKSVDDYELVKVLGKGCMGKVLLAREKTSNRLFAIKSISKLWVAQHGPQEIEHTRAEQRILAELSRTRNPFLIKLHCSFQNHENLFLVLDYVGGGDLATQLAKWNRFCVSRSRFYCAEMVEGIRELHRLGVIYRDLKPENVLLSPTGHIILTDFGLSKQFKISHRLHQTEHESGRCTSGEKCTSGKTSTFCGTAEYLAPEVLREELYGYEVDWWSLGTFLYEMLTGMTPFWAEDQVTMYRRVLDDELEFPEDLIGVDARDLIAGLLTRNPQKRLGYGAQGAMDVRRHPFFRHINWDDLFNLRIPPPYTPNMRCDVDLSNFDEEFTNMTPRISVMQMGGDGTCGNDSASATGQCGDNCGCSSALSQSIQDKFAGYSFICGSQEDHWQSMSARSAVAVASDNASFVTVAETTITRPVTANTTSSAAYAAAAFVGAKSPGNITVTTSSWLSRFKMKRRRSSVMPADQPPPQRDATKKCDDDEESLDFIMDDL